MQAALSHLARGGDEGVDAAKTKGRNKHRRT